MILDRSAPLLDCPVSELLDRLAAKQPTPGGGGAAAITAAMAAGLLGMAARFSTAQLIDSAGRAADADRVRTQVAALAEQDAEAYQAVLAAFALPRQPDPQVRRGQIRRSLERAAQVPAQIAEIASDIATEAIELAKEATRTCAATPSRQRPWPPRRPDQPPSWSGSMSNSAISAAISPTAPPKPLTPPPTR
jgi:formiminotetrahydrofolate cyclodeaminase